MINYFQAIQTAILCNKNTFKMFKPKLFFLYSDGLVVNTKSKAKINWFSKCGFRFLQG